jgi:hypothetical protein
MISRGGARGGRGGAGGGEPGEGGRGSGKSLLPCTKGKRAAGSIAFECDYCVSNWGQGRMSVVTASVHKL